MLDVAIQDEKVCHNVVFADPYSLHSERELFGV